MICILASIAANSGKGSDIVKHISQVASPPGRTYSYLGLAQAIKDIRAGKDINYEGAGGSADFDQNGDLKAAQSHGLKTAFVPRPTEYGPHQKRDFEATGDWTMVVKDFNDLAARLGC